MWNSSATPEAASAVHASNTTIEIRKIFNSWPAEPTVYLPEFSKLLAVHPTPLETERDPFLPPSAALHRCFRPVRQWLPDYRTFLKVCRFGLGTVRPIVRSAATEDEWGWNFGSARPPSYFAYGRMRALLSVAMAADVGDSSVLEIAAGDGALSACLETRGCAVTVNDLREAEITDAVRNYTNSARIGIVAGNALELDPARIGRFDLVIACELMEHVADPVALLRKLRSLMALNGRIFLTTPNGRYFRNRLPTYRGAPTREEMERRQFKPDADGHLYLITPEEMVELASEAGLQMAYYTTWGTPFLTGESGFRALGPLLPTNVCYLLERMCSYLPLGLQERLGNSSAYVFKPKDQP